MIKKNIKEVHEQLMQNVREENEKERRESLNPLFNINSKNNLISIAKETLKPKVYKPYKVYEEYRNSLSRGTYHSINSLLQQWREDEDG